MLTKKKEKEKKNEKKPKNKTKNMHSNRKVISTFVIVCT